MAKAERLNVRKEQNFSKASVLYNRALDYLVKDLRRQKPEVEYQKPTLENREKFVPCCGDGGVVIGLKEKISEILGVMGEVSVAMAQEREEEIMGMRMMIEIEGISKGEGEGEGEEWKKAEKARIVAKYEKTFKKIQRYQRILEDLPKEGQDEETKSSVSTNTRRSTGGTKRISAIEELRVRLKQLY